MFCREAVASLSALEGEIAARGGTLVFVGNGTPLMAQAFVEQFQVTAPLYTDPSRAAFKAAGLTRAFGLNLSSVARGRRAMASGHRQGKVQGDPWQQGGVLVLDGDGVERYRQNTDEAGEALLLPPVLAALDALA